MNKIWPFGFNFLMFAGFATVGPFIVLYYQELGFKGMQIGLLTGIAPLVTLGFAPLWTRIADRTLRHRLMMSLAIVGGLVVVALFPTLHAFGPILVLAILLNVFLSPVTPFADSAAMAMLGEQKHMYGRIRLGGTIGYGVATSLAGVLVQHYGIDFAFWGCAALFLLALAVSQRLVYGEPRVLKATSERGSIRALLRDPRWPLFLAVAFASGLSHASLNYLFPYMRELGATESVMGLALTIGTIAEVPILFFAHRLIKRFRPHVVIMVSMVIMGLRLLLYAATATPTLVLIIQLLNGVTLPLMWVAAVSYANEMAPKGMKATAQGMLSGTVYGFGMAVGGFMGGPLLENLGGRGLYLMFGIVVLAILGIVALLQNRLPVKERSDS